MTCLVMEQLFQKDKAMQIEIKLTNVTLYSIVISLELGNGIADEHAAFKLGACD